MPLHPNYGFMPLYSTVCYISSSKLVTTTKLGRMLDQLVLLYLAGDFDVTPPPSVNVIKICAFIITFISPMTTKIYRMVSHHALALSFK